MTQFFNVQRRRWLGWSSVLTLDAMTGTRVAKAAVAMRPHSRTTPAVVDVAMAKQPWHVGRWFPSALEVEVEQGQSILVLTGQWNNNGVRARGLAPRLSPSPHHLEKVVDQATAILGNLQGPPVYGQIYAAFDLPAGRYAITPPDEGGGAGDGTMFAVVVRGIAGLRAASMASVWRTGAAMPGIAVTSDGGVRAGDLVVALAGFDNTDVNDRVAGITDPPPGWASIGANQDVRVFPPMQASWTIATHAGAQAIAWGWLNPSVNVAFAVVAAFAPSAT